MPLLFKDCMIEEHQPFEASAPASAEQPGFDAPPECALMEAPAPSPLVVRKRSAFESLSGVICGVELVCFGLLEEPEEPLGP